MTPELRPATQADIVAAFRSLYNEERQIPVRVLAYTGRLGDKVIAVGGVAFYPNGARVAFLDITDEGRRYPLSLHRGAKKVLEQARRHGVKSVIVVDDEQVHDKTPNWLRHLGFVREQINGVRCFVWKAS